MNGYTSSIKYPSFIKTDDALKLCFLDSVRYEFSDISLNIVKHVYIHRPFPTQDISYSRVRLIFRYVYWFEN